VIEGFKSDAAEITNVYRIKEKAGVFVFQKTAAKDFFVNW